jgi:hypothetical protein
MLYCGNFSAVIFIEIIFWSNQPQAGFYMLLLLICFDMLQYKRFILELPNVFFAEILIILLLKITIQKIKV